MSDKPEAPKDRIVNAFIALDLKREETMILEKAFYRDFNVNIGNRKVKIVHDEIIMLAFNGQSEPAICGVESVATKASRCINWSVRDSDSTDQIHIHKGYIMVETRNELLVLVDPKIEYTHTSTWPIWLVKELVRGGHIEL